MSSNGNTDLHWYRWFMRLGAIGFATAFWFLTPNAREQSKDFESGTQSGLLFAGALYCASEMKR